MPRFIVEPMRPSPSDGDIGDMWVDSAELTLCGPKDEAEWPYVASLESKGGKKGEPGESAYEIAVRHGFLGTEEQWLLSLRARSSGGGAVMRIVEPTEVSTSNNTLAWLGL